MKILMIYPKCPETFWGFKYALRFISKKASLPPLGLLTVASLLPANWEKRLIDTHVKKLTNRDILWADYVFISAMIIQEKSVREVIERCKALGRKIVAGGPLFTTNLEQFSDVDHLVLNEAEVNLPKFITDLKNGNPEHIYDNTRKADMTKSPLPMLDLIKSRPYATMSIQFSRGCPLDCEFCNVTVLLGRQYRTKTKEQILMEMENIYRKGWKGGVFFVDDNFIGNKAKLKNEILPAIIGWMRAKNYPFSFITQASLDLSDDPELMKMMALAGFNVVFIGIESVDEKSLLECNKFKNQNRDLIACVKKIQKNGLEVQAGFIVGFDSDSPTIFERIIDFVQKSGIATSMVGMLNAPKGTKLYKRLQREGRIVKADTGDNTDFATNLEPLMGSETLLNGYRKILQKIYSPKYYYARLIIFLKNYKPLSLNRHNFSFNRIMAGLKSVLWLGIIGKERVQYWKIFFWSLLKKPKLFPLAITLSIYGHHFRRVFEKQK